MQKWLCLLVIALCLTAPGSLWADQWEDLNPTGAPLPRCGHTLVELSGSAYLFGGLMQDGRDQSVLNDLWNYDFEDNAWSPVSTQYPPQGRAYHSAAVSNGKMYIFGGNDGAGNAFNDVWSYTPGTNKWQQETVSGPVLPTPSSHHSSTTLPDGRIAMLGGKKADGTINSDWLWLYTPSTGAWERKAGYDRRYGHSAAVINNKLYVLPGSAYSGYSSAIWAYDLAQSTWSTVTPKGDVPSARSLYGFGQTSDQLWMFGGEGEGSTELNDTWQFNPTTNAWTKGANLPITLKDTKAILRPQSRLDTKLLLFGGISNGVPNSRTFQYSSGSTPPVEKVMLTQIGALGRGQFAMLFLHFPKVQATVKAQLEWSQTDVKLRLCAYRLPHHLGFHDHLWEQFAFDRTFDMMDDRMPKHGLLGQSDHYVQSPTDTGNKLEATLTKVQCAVVWVKHSWRCAIARDIQLRIKDNTEQPKNACFLFPVGTFDKNNQPRLNFVHFPVTPIRWHSQLPHGYVGEETIVPGSDSWEWRFLDRTPRPRWFGFVRFTLP